MKLQIIVLLIAMAAIFGCKKDSATTTPTDTKKENTLTAKISGFNNYTFNGTHVTVAKLYYDIGITALSDNGAIILNFSDLGVRDYDLSNPMIICTYTGPGSNYPYGSESGKLSITQSDNISIKGTFNFVGRQTKDTTKVCTISNGSFTVYR